MIRFVEACKFQNRGGHEESQGSLFIRDTQSLTSGAAGGPQGSFFIREDEVVASGATGGAKDHSLLETTKW